MFGLIQLGLLASCVAEQTPFPPGGAVWEPALGSWNSPVLQADNTTWEASAVQEPQIIYQPSTKALRMWYRGAGWGAPSAVGVADSTDGGRTWTKYPGNPVWGGPGKPLEYGGQPFVYQEENGTYWLFTTTNAKPPRVAIAQSADGLHWTNVSWGPFTEQSHVPVPPTGTLFGNRAVWKDDDGTWKLLQECGTTEGVWQIFLYEGTDILTWKVANGGKPLLDLQRHKGSMYGGCHIATVDGKFTPRNPNTGRYEIWYHAGADGNLPTDVYHATSADLMNWTVAPAGPVVSHVGKGSFAFDQTADPSPATVGCQAFLAYDGDNNGCRGCSHAAIGLAIATIPNCTVAN
eukprot:m.46529 g.46529  ORF g.46529 m.46529 type:complete len:347 (-) comp20271_c0_seq1:437-1477(-)